jgi:hypothetical protein
MSERLWLPLAIIAFVIIFLFAADTVVFRTAQVSLANSATPITDGNYDTFESPRGTAYQVPNGDTLFLTAWLIGFLTSDADISFEVGHAADAVSNSAAPPTDPVVLFALSYHTSGGLNGLPFNVAVPGGRYPYVRATGANYNIDVVGVLE